MKISTSNHDCWSELSKVQLTENEVELFREQLDWGYLCEHGEYSEKLWEKMIKQIDFEQLAKNPNVPVRFLTKYHERIDWTTYARKTNFTKEKLLETMEYLPTREVYYNNNNTYRLLSQKSWNMFFEVNGFRFRERTRTEMEKESFLLKHILDEKTLVDFANEWTERHVWLISLTQPVTHEFCQKTNYPIKNDLLESTNRLHRLTKDELLELREENAKHYNTLLESGKHINWETDPSNLVFPRWFVEVHKEKMGDNIYAIHKWRSERRI